MGRQTGSTHLKQASVLQLPSRRRSRRRATRAGCMWAASRPPAMSRTSPPSSPMPWRLLGAPLQAQVCARGPRFECWCIQTGLRSHTLCFAPMICTPADWAFEVVCTVLNLNYRAPSSSAGPSVVNVYINYEKKFAFVEFRTGQHSHMLTA